MHFQRAAAVKPNEPDPYLDAAETYDPDLNIPPLTELIKFLREGAKHVGNVRTIYAHLSYLYEHAGNDEMTLYYRRQANSGGTTPPMGDADILPPSIL